MTDFRPKVDLVQAVVRGLADGRDVNIEVREGLIIETRPDGDPIIKADGQTYELKDVPESIESEILNAAREHREVIEGLETSKYLDPSYNPMIKKGE